MINKIIEELFIKNGIEDIKVSKSNRPEEETVGVGGP